MEFKVVNMDDIMEDDNLQSQMIDIIHQYDYIRLLDLQFIRMGYEDDDVCGVFSFRDGEMLAFAIVCADKKCSEDKATLMWFVSDKEKTKNFESQLLLNQVIKHCREKGFKKLGWECFRPSWKNVKHIEDVFEKFGYKVAEAGYGHVSLDIE